MKTFEWEAEVFAVGRWNDVSVTLSDLNGIVDSFRKLKSYINVPLKLGHNDDQPMTDGEPALGWVKDLRVDETANPPKLFAMFSDVPDVVHKAVKAKRYRSPSIELLFDVTHKGTRYPLVMTGVALLGADIPAVNVLADLDAYMSADLVAYSGSKSPALFGRSSQVFTYQRTGVSTMDLEEMKKELDKLKGENALLSQKFSAASAEADRLKQAETERAEAQAKEKVKFARKAVSDVMEKAVTEKRILPAQREALFSLLSVEDDAAVVKIDLAQVEALIKGQEQKDFSGSGARQQGDREIPTGAEASKELVTKTRKFMAEHGERNFSAALVMVMRANPDLSEEHVFSNGIVQH